MTVSWIAIVVHGSVLAHMEAQPPAPGELAVWPPIHVRCSGEGSPAVILEAGACNDGTQYHEVRRIRSVDNERVGV